MEHMFQRALTSRVYISQWLLITWLYTWRILSLPSTDCGLLEVYRHRAQSRVGLETLNYACASGSRKPVIIDLAAESHKSTATPQKFKL